jgi:type VI secretion system protein ImpH
LDSLPVAQLGGAPVLLGMTGVLGLGGDTGQISGHDSITINLGRYQGLQSNPQDREIQHVEYRF